MPNLEELCVEGNAIVTPPYSVINNGFDSMRHYLEVIRQSYNTNTLELDFNELACLENVVSDLGLQGERLAALEQLAINYHPTPPGTLLTPLANNSLFMTSCVSGHCRVEVTMIAAACWLS